jgi:hypothetical protein
MVAPLNPGWNIIDFGPGVPLDAFSASRKDMPSGPGLLIKAVMLEVSPFRISDELVTVTVTVVVILVSRRETTNGGVAYNPWLALAELLSSPDVLNTRVMIRKANMGTIILKANILAFITSSPACRDTQLSVLLNTIVV